MPRGRKPIGDRAMTDAERQRRHRERLYRERGTAAKPSENVAELQQQVAELQRQLKAARTRNQNLTVEVKMAWQAAKVNPVTITKADHKKLLKVFHPDAEVKVTAKRTEQLTAGFQIFSGLKLRVIDTD